jgi:hypothetical protein
MLPQFGPSSSRPAAPEPEVVEVATEAQTEDAPQEVDEEPAETRVEEAPEPLPEKTAAGGETVASLGDPTKPGLWLETPIVSSETKGKVRVKATGATLEVTLIPIPGEATAGSRMSVEAMRALGVGLADLVELEVSVAG